MILYDSIYLSVCVLLVDGFWKIIWQDNLTKNGMLLLHVQSRETERKRGEI